MYVLRDCCQVESLKNFDFDEWRQRYVTWTRTNKLKYMDFFRRLDREGTGLVTRKQFIEAILSSSTSTAMLMFCHVFLQCTCTVVEEYKR